MHTSSTKSASPRNWGIFSGTLSNVASKYGLNLDAIAEANLAKAHGRWMLRGRAGANLGPAPSFDATFREHERFPRQFEVEITETHEGDAVRVRAFVGGNRLGDPLTDNAYGADGYRFRDVFHLAYAAVLGWSPVAQTEAQEQPYRRRSRGWLPGTCDRRRHRRHNFHLCP